GREFLLFAHGPGGYTFEQTPDMLPAAIGKCGDVKPWHVQQAAAVRIYCYQYRGAKDGGAPDEAGSVEITSDLPVIGQIERFSIYSADGDVEYAIDPLQRRK
ncbi:hypothetical protein JW905_11420, partial [bacterium]|nr:hypothetical protein [candidate division CSSED10-310 bacterium]